jgi:hypothetical protein
MAEIQSLQDQLRSANEHVSQYKSIRYWLTCSFSVIDSASQASEECVRDLNKANDEYRTSVESRLATLNEELEAARTQLATEIAEVFCLV